MAITLISTYNDIKVMINTDIEQPKYILELLLSIGVI